MIRMRDTLIFHLSPAAPRPISVTVFLDPFFIKLSLLKKPFEGTKVIPSAKIFICHHRRDIRDAPSTPFYDNRA